MVNQVHLADAPAWGPRSQPLLADHRTDGFRFELLDTRNRVLRPLRGVSEFTAEFNLWSTIRSGGSCRYAGDEDIDWTGHRIRAYATVSGAGRSMEWPVGTFIVKAPRTEYTAATRQAPTLQLFDMMSRLQEQASTAVQWMGYKGTNVIDRLRYLLDRQNIAHSFEDNEALFGTNMSWPPATSYLRMVNDMLDVAQCFSATADPMGVIRGDPHRPPQYRGITAVFTDAGDGMPFLPELVHEADFYDVPNQMTVVTESDDPDVLPMRGTFLDRTSRFAWAATGRVVSALEENAPASATQAELDARAERRLRQKQQVSETFEVQHPTLPLALNDVVRLEWGGRDLSALAVVEGFTYSQEAGALSTTKLRRVVE